MLKRSKSQRVPIREQLKRAAAELARQPSHKRERAREAVHETDSVKKYVIPNIPYLFILWACLKLGTAYRLAPGADFAHKLMGLGQSIGRPLPTLYRGLLPLTGS